MHRDPGAHGGQTQWKKLLEGGPAEGHVARLRNRLGSLGEVGDGAVDGSGSECVLGVWRDLALNPGSLLLDEMMEGTSRHLGKRLVRCWSERPPCFSPDLVPSQASLFSFAGSGTRIVSPSRCRGDA